MNIFIHRRDIRHDDNTTLYQMMSELKEPIVPIFIFTPEQISDNPYFSSNLVQFMCLSLLDLDQDYQKKKSKLYCFYGHVEKVLNKIHNKFPIKNLGFNNDYSPYAKKRDNQIYQWCQKNKIKCWHQEDMLLVNILNQKNYPNEHPYKVFTPFMKYLKKTFPVLPPIVKKKPLLGIFPESPPGELSVKKINSFYTFNPNLLVKPGRSSALITLNNLKDQQHYNENRNLLTYETSHLSAYINLGLISIREVYQMGQRLLKTENTFIDELYWRDFYYNILHHFPHIVGKSFKEKYDNIKWDNNEEQFQLWCQGQTGFPIVDACMRQLNTTGYMHNRGRMIVASFLTKDLFIDWRWGEKYFATQLTDYNVSANNGGWQWSAGSGTDAQPYFRIFNPWTQIDKFDPHCQYILKWVPELKDIPLKDIKKWDQTWEKYPNCDYPQPMVNHKERYHYTLQQYKKYL